MHTPSPSRWNQHSLILIAGGTYMMSIGWSYLFSAISVLRYRSLSVALNILPLEWWGGIFMAVGIAAWLFALVFKRKQVWGFTLLTGLSAAWGTVYILAIKEPPNVDFQVTQALMWYLLAIVWWGVAGLVSPKRLADVANKFERRKDADSPPK